MQNQSPTSKSVLEQQGDFWRWAFRKRSAVGRTGVWIVLLLSSGCGYRPVAMLLPDDRTLAVSTFSAQVADATVPAAVTRGVREALMSRGWKIVSDRKDSRPRLVGRVARYERTPTALNFPGQAQRYRLSMTLAYRLRHGDRRGPERQVVGISEYAVSPDAMRAQTAERQAVREAARQAGEALADALPELLSVPLESNPSPDLPSPHP